MSCTIFYNGKLKSEYTFNNMVSVVQKHAESMACKLNISRSILVNKKYMKQTNSGL